MRLRLVEEVHQVGHYTPAHCSLLLAQPHCCLCRGNGLMFRSLSDLPYSSCRGIFALFLLNLWINTTLSSRLSMMHSCLITFFSHRSLLFPISLQSFSRSQRPMYSQASRPACPATRCDYLSSVVKIGYFIIPSLQLRDVIISY